MAINTTSLTTLINEFKAVQSKDAITPSSLGFILQRIVDLLSTAGTSDAVSKIQSLLNNLKVANKAVCSLEQGDSDPNNVLADIKTVDLGTGAVSNSSNNIFIQQATTQRAGAMRAQQVVDLNQAVKDVAAHEKAIASTLAQIESIFAKLGMDGSAGIYNTSQIICVVHSGQLHVLGASKLISEGYVPYIFRNVRKRNPYKLNTASEEKLLDKKYCIQKKGWGVFGSMYAVKIDGTQVLFSNRSHEFLCNPHEDEEYSGSPTAYVSSHVDNSGHTTFGWGRTSVKLTDMSTLKKGKPKKERFIRLRFGIGFGKPIYPGTAPITPANLASSMAEFSIIYDPATRTWAFSR